MIVLFATDGSPQANHAIREAARLLALKDASLYVVAVAPTIDFPVSATPGGVAGAAYALQGALIQRLDAGTSGHLADAARQFAALGLTATPLERGGDPAEEILAAAREVGADVIVLGTHGYGAIERFLRGSVSDEVNHHAAHAVLVVRPEPAS